MGKERTLATTGLCGLRRGRACLQQSLGFQLRHYLPFHFKKRAGNLALARVGQPNGAGRLRMHVARQLP